MSSRNKHFEKACGQFRDVRKRILAYDLRWESSKSCLIVGGICCFLFATTFVTAAATLLVPDEIMAKIWRIFYVLFPALLKPTTLHLHNLKLRPKPDRNTTSVTHPTTTTTRSTPKATNATTTTTTPPPTRARTQPSKYDVVYKFDAGAARGDVTLPFYNHAFYGHMNPDEKGDGLHTRQFARAFCFSQNKKKVVYVVVDTYGISYHIRSEVIKELAKGKHKDFSITNLHIVGTGTHHTPGCHMVEYLFGTGPPYSAMCAQIFITNIKKSVEKACDALQPAYLFVANADLYFAQFNRSPRAYIRNPAKERDRYLVQIDYRLTQLRIESRVGGIIGVVNWAGVRASNLGPWNSMLSSDNLGYAALRMERDFNPGVPAGKGSVVVAFAPTAIGDISPTLKQGRCTNKWDHVCINRRYCNDDWNCVVTVEEGDWVRLDEIGARLYTSAKTALEIQGSHMNGSLEYGYTNFASAKNYSTHYDTVTSKFSDVEAVSCFPFVGQDFLKKFIFDSDKLETDEKLVWKVRSNLESIGDTPWNINTCQYPKKVIWSYGKGVDRLFPTDFTVSVINLGGLVIACVPAEPSTMVGRRIMEVMQAHVAIASAAREFVVSALANEYIMYVATREEYAEREWAGELTCFGANTAEIILNMVARVTKEVTGPATEVIKHEQRGMVGQDKHHSRSTNLYKASAVSIPPVDKNFGDVLQDAENQYRKGQALKMMFVVTNPEVDIRTGHTLYALEKEDFADWTDVVYDADWETKYAYDANKMEATVTWKIPMDFENGRYRMRYYGTKSNGKDVTGLSRKFTIR